MRPHPALFTALAALALSACGPGTDTADSAPVAEAVGDSAVVTEPAPPVGRDMDADAADMGMRAFSCESGHRVELVGEDMARITLADGRVIELPRRPDGVAEYRGEALTFDIDDDGRGGILGQDEVGGFACEPAD